MLFMIKFGGSYHTKGKENLIAERAALSPEGEKKVKKKKFLLGLPYVWEIICEVEGCETRNRRNK